MNISDLKPLINDLRSSPRWQAIPEGQAIADAMARLFDRFGDGATEELVKALDGLKPKKKPTKRSSGKPSAPPAAIVGTYVAQLRNAQGDPAATGEVMKRLRADKAVKKGEAVAIAEGVGIRTTSKTTKVQALTQIEGQSHQLERDRVTAERIRRGA